MSNLHLSSGFNFDLQILIKNICIISIPYGNEHDWTLVKYLNVLYHNRTFCVSELEHSIFRQIFLSIKCEISKDQDWTSHGPNLGVTMVSLITLKTLTLYGEKNICMISFIFWQLALNCYWICFSCVCGKTFYQNFQTIWCDFGYFVHA